MKAIYVIFAAALLACILYAQQKPAAGSGWEYRHESLSRIERSEIPFTENKPEEVKAAMAKLQKTNSDLRTQFDTKVAAIGKQGWEMVCVSPEPEVYQASDGLVITGTTFYFKRRK